MRPFSTHPSSKYSARLWVGSVYVELSTVDMDSCHNALITVRELYLGTYKGPFRVKDKLDRITYLSWADRILDRMLELKNEGTESRTVVLG